MLAACVGHDMAVDRCLLAPAEEKQTYVQTHWNFAVSVWHLKVSKHKRVNTHTHTHLHTFTAHPSQMKFANEKQEQYQQQLQKKKLSMGNCQSRFI